MRTIRLFLFFCAMGITLVVVAQNAAVVTVRFLVWETQMSQVVLLLLTLAVGAVLGLLGVGMRAWRR